jgi:hypothetical protein
MANALAETSQTVCLRASGETASVPAVPQRGTLLILVGAARQTGPLVPQQIPPLQRASWLAHA